jgi:hypothetical protein
VLGRGGGGGGGTDIGAGGPGSVAIDGGAGGGGGRADDGGGGGGAPNIGDEGGGGRGASGLEDVADANATRLGGGGGGDARNGVFDGPLGEGASGFNALSPIAPAVSKMLVASSSPNSTRSGPESPNTAVASSASSKLSSCGFSAAEGNAGVGSSVSGTDSRAKLGGGGGACSRLRTDGGGGGGRLPREPGGGGGRFPEAEAGPGGTGKPNSVALRGAEGAGPRLSNTSRSDPSSLICVRFFRNLIGFCGV